MKEIVIFMLVLAVVLAHGGNKPRRYYNKFVNDDMIDDLKKKNVTWQVMDPDENPLRKFSDDQMASVLSMIGGDIEKHDKKMHNQLEAGRRFNSIRSSDRNLKSSVNEPLKSALPVSFDWRTSDIAKRCKPNVLAQESCGACYAFATAQVFAARYCSVTSGNVVDFSPQDILACNSRTNACNGGILDIAANYLEEYGVASLACIPYKEQNTPDTSNTPSQKCSTTCTVSGVTMEKKFCKKGTTIMLYGKERIKNEIYARGPVASSMTVWSDLSSYKTGVYKQTSGTKQGGHAIILIGWGTENGAEYWIVQNSWGADWGDAGYFKQDMSDTNSAMGEYAVYCVPDV